MLKQFFATPLRLTVIAFLVLCLVSGGLAGGVRILHASASMVGQDMTIYNYADLVAFRDRVNAGWDFNGRTITQAADINMAGLPWFVGIGAQRNTFRGTFDGNGYRIMNLTGGNGLFERVHSGTIRNVHMTNVNINNLATATNEFVSIHTGAIVGFHNFQGGQLLIENCTVNGGTIHGQSNVGGIVGISVGTINITGSSVIANVSSAGAVSGDAPCIGGIIGNSSGANSTILNCYFSGTVSATTTRSTASLRVGGIIGEPDGAGIRIADCFVEGTVHTTGTAHESSHVGGIVGRLFSSNAIVERNYIATEITATVRPAAAGGVSAGGVAGNVPGTTPGQVTVRNNAINTSVVQALNSTVLRRPSEVTVVTTPHIVQHGGNNRINTLNVGGTTPASISGLTRITATSRDATWFATQASYTTASNWSAGGAWNFTENWIMSSNTTADGVNRPLPRAYVDNVVNFQPKTSIPNPTCPTTPLLAEIDALRVERDQLATDLGIALGNLGTATTRITELEGELATARANPCFEGCVHDDYVCLPLPCDCSPPIEPCDCPQALPCECPPCDCQPCSCDPCTDCATVIYLQGKIEEYQIAIATITTEIESIFEEGWQDGTDFGGLLAALKAMIEEMRAKELATQNQNANATFDTWLFISIGLALVCVSMLVTMIIIGRRKVNVNIKR
jgi:hypothetical protein